MSAVAFHLNCLAIELGECCKTQDILCQFGIYNSNQIVYTLSTLVDRVPLHSVQKEVANLMFEICEEIENKAPYISGKRVWLRKLLIDEL